jgi:hypothetical protein
MVSVGFVGACVAGSFDAIVQEGTTTQATSAARRIATDRGAGVLVRAVEPGMATGYARFAGDRRGEPISQHAL